MALELQPDDRECLLTLMECYDAVNDDAAATTQLLRLIALQPHDESLYQQLSECLQENPKEAERAETSLIESGAKWSRQF